MRTIDSIIGQNRNKIIIIFSLAIILCFIVLKVKFNSIYMRIIQEDNILEYPQFLIDLASAWIGFLIARDFFSKQNILAACLFIIFSLALLFISLEEISWGQRILGFQGAPIVVQHNTQHEFTLHNLNRVQPLIAAAYIIIGFYGSFMDLLLPGRLKNKSLFKFIVPDRILFFYFFPALVIYLYQGYGIRFLVDRLGIQFCEIGFFFVWRDQEPAEFILSLGFLWFILMTRSKQREQMDLPQG